MRPTRRPAVHASDQGERGAADEVSALRARVEGLEHELALRDEVEREARTRADATVSYRDLFLGILGHDLRNPLNTILTTARLLSMKPSLASDDARKLKRLIASGQRLETMIRQLLDVTRARLADGIPVAPVPRQDVTAVVKLAIEDLGVTHPRHAVALRGDPRCAACVDAVRLQQAVGSLIENAIDHGAGGWPIVVTVRDLGERVVIEVHNQGKPISRGRLENLFDPFARADTAHVRSDGLGLGLYIAERILHAHGGTIAVTSSAEDGTRFAATFPTS